MARRKNTRRFDPRYFMDEKTDVIKEELRDYYGGKSHSQSKADAAMPRRPDFQVPPAGMTKEDEDFLIDNDFSDPPMGLTDVQEKAYVDALRESPENHDEIYEQFKDVAYKNEYERGL